MPNVVTRFAPSPTGFLHIGGARTALFNLLYARNTGGKFILRIEDTDQERSTPEAVDAILDGMTWLGIAWDEGPHFQMERMELYRKEADRLVAEGKAYRCVCTKEELDARREEMAARKEKPRYDGRCRNVPESAKAGKPSVLRFKAPRAGQTVVRDLLRGDVVYENAELDDLVFLRTDGSPTYNFVVVIDDASMGITHVLRGDDHLNNTPKQVLLYEALGYPLPRFGHFPLIHGMEGGKLSKRQDDVSVTAYREKGFLPEAMVNYLVRLGWGHGDQEIFSMVEMQDLFSLEHVGKSPSKFNLDKLLHLNAHYIKMAEPDADREPPRPLPREARDRREAFPVAHFRRPDAAGAVPHPRGDGRIRGILLPPEAGRSESGGEVPDPGDRPGPPRDRRCVFRPRRLQGGYGGRAESGAGTQGGGPEGSPADPRGPHRGDRVAGAVRGDGDPRAGRGGAPPAGRRRADWRLTQQFLFGYLVRSVGEW